MRERRRRPGRRRPGRRGGRPPRSAAEHARFGRRGGPAPCPTGPGVAACDAAGNPGGIGHRPSADGGNLARPARPYSPDRPRPPHTLRCPRFPDRSAGPGTPQARCPRGVTVSGGRPRFPAGSAHSVALRTALRKGELLGLHWEDLDLTTGTVSIRRSLQRTRTGGLTHLPTKTRGPNAASPSRPNASIPQGRQGAAGHGTPGCRLGQEGQRPGLHHADRWASRPCQPPVASVASSTGPDSAASASTTSDTRRRPFSWSRAWTSS
ncbi:hypothetical protein SAMN05421870_11673 [Streptomyces qinglanensis]|uniref:Phage integrase family protein n=1 Tax=Streptomyces qinglanensis TaxID=943816 RepID=A0A1H9WAC9_9ACTN|nr:hypothetical protein SAMN05421870_11673 [Streptomyces qinglanensis]